MEIFAGIFAFIMSLLPLLVILLVLSLYHGYNESINDAAHLSGLFFGFVLAAVLILLFPPKWRRNADLPR